MREFTSSLKTGANESETSSLSTYAFLYGTIPTAPAVFVFSNLYQLEMDLVSFLTIFTVRHNKHLYKLEFAGVEKMNNFSKRHNRHSSYPSQGNCKKWTIHKLMTRWSVIGTTSCSR